MFKAFVLDSLGNIRGICPDPDQKIPGCNISLNKKFDLIFHPPSLDQKMIGTWKLYIFIFDKKTEELASYGIYEFDVKEKGSLNNTTYIILYLLVFLQFIVILSYIYRYMLKRKEKGSINQISGTSEAVETNVGNISLFLDELIKGQIVKPQSTNDSIASSVVTEGENSSRSQKPN